MTVERIDGQAPQAGQVAQRAEALGNVGSQRADISALRTTYLELQAVPLQAHQTDLVDGDPPRRAFDGLAPACQLVQALSLMLQRRVHGGDLLLLAGKTGQHRTHFGWVQWRYRGTFDDGGLEIQ